MMKWISKQPPLYVWLDDIWIREPDYSEFKCDLKNQCWFNDSEKVFFPKKSKIMTKEIL